MYASKLGMCICGFTHNCRDLEHLGGRVSSSIGNSILLLVHLILKSHSCCCSFSISMWSRTSVYGDIVWCIFCMCYRGDTSSNTTNIPISSLVSISTALINIYNRPVQSGKITRLWVDSIWAMLEMEVSNSARLGWEVSRRTILSR
jgi:hypothetical protein